jgi:hypothetical protein
MTSQVRGGLGVAIEHAGSRTPSTPSLEVRFEALVKALK